MKALDFAMKSARASMPWVVPSSSERARAWEALVSMLRCLVYLGHSLMIWLRVSRMLLSHGQWVGSWERGRKD